LEINKNNTHMGSESALPFVALWWGLPKRHGSGESKAEEITDLQHTAGVFSGEGREGGGEALHSSQSRVEEKTIK